MKHVCKVALLSLMALVGTVGAKDYSIYVMPDEQRKQLEICAAWATGMQFNFEIFFAAGAKVPDNIARGAEGETPKHARSVKDNDDRFDIYYFEKYHANLGSPLDSKMKWKDATRLDSDQKKIFDAHREKLQEEFTFIEQNILQNILQKKPGEEQKPEKTELSATIYLMPKKLSEKVILEFCVPEQKLLFQKNATPEALTQAQQESLGTFKHGKAEYGLVLLKQPNPQIPGIDSREDKQIDIAREFLTGGFKRLSIAENDRIFLTGTEGDNAYTSIRQLLQDRKELVQQILAPYKKQLEQTPIPPTGTPQTGTPLPISDDLDNLVRALKQLASVTGH